jgi:probable rRNA maturation factor
LITVKINNRQDELPIDRRRIRCAVQTILADRGVRKAQIGVTVLDDPAIRELNCRYLDHDYATDVLSFPMEQSRGEVEGEIVVSAQTAAANARYYGLAPADELLLYVIHGTLHLVGLRDKRPKDRAAMRAAERRYLAQFGVTLERRVGRAQRVPPRKAKTRARGARHVQ